MELLSNHIDFGVASALVVPLLIAVLVAALALVTGAAGRVALVIEELPYRRSVGRDSLDAGQIPDRSLLVAPIDRRSRHGRK